MAAGACIDPIETAADKLSALAWRVCSRERGTEYADPSIIRHLHDLAGLESHSADANKFRALILKAAEADAGRGSTKNPVGLQKRLQMMLDILRRDPLWAREYEKYVADVSLAAVDERIKFAEALEAAWGLIAGL